jgi:hypothetical protein
MGAVHKRKELEKFYANKENGGCTKGCCEEEVRNPSRTADRRIDGH